MVASLAPKLLTSVLFLFLRGNFHLRFLTVIAILENSGFGDRNLLCNWPLLGLRLSCKPHLHNGDVDPPIIE